MLDDTAALPDDPEALRGFAARLLAEVKAQAMLIAKLRHQLAGHRVHRFGTSSETADQLQFALETSEIAAAAMTAKTPMQTFLDAKPLAQEKMIAAWSASDRRDPTDIQTADVRESLNFYTWFDEQPEFDPERLIFIDETGLNTKMARLRGRCRRGERLFASIPHGHWNTTTFVAGLRLAGMDAPMVLDGVDAFSPEECTNYFVDAGYEPE